MVFFDHCGGQHAGNYAARDIVVGNKEQTTGKLNELILVSTERHISTLRFFSARTSRLPTGFVIEWTRYNENSVHKNKITTINLKGAFRIHSKADLLDS